MEEGIMIKSIRDCRTLGVVLVLSTLPAWGEPTVYTDRQAFATATSTFVTPVTINFNGLWAEPLNNILAGRRPFPGDYYADRGIVFRQTDNVPLYIAPGELFWNASNSLSIGQFPFAPLPGSHEDDDLVVALDPPCLAVGLTLVDNGPQSRSEFIEFLDDSGNVIAQAPFPPNFSTYRAFIGILSEDQPVASIHIFEDALRGDDIDHDDFVLVQDTGATLHLVVGNGSGSSPIVGSSHLFQTQVGPVVEAAYPLLLTDLPEFVMPVAARRTDHSAGADVESLALPRPARAVHKRPRGASAS
jgi:hypothetical protein